MIGEALPVDRQHVLMLITMLDDKLHLSNSEASRLLLHVAAQLRSYAILGIHLSPSLALIFLPTIVLHVFQKLIISLLLLFQITPRPLPQLHLLQRILFCQ